MTERFIVDDDGIVTDMLDLSMYVDEEDCCEKLNELHEENQNTKAILNDFMSILNRLQANPTDKKLLGIARDMLQNMGVDLE